MRCMHLTLAAVVASVFPLLLSAGEAVPPNFSGTWQLDAARSQIRNAGSITYTIEDTSGKINFSRIVQDTDGKSITSKFSCDTVGTQCEFEEGNRKAKVSLWYDGTALVILKTDGPKEDSVTQWRLELAPDGNTLNVKLTHIEPVEQPETMVFEKKSS
ncbi:MAG TPA: hypothetical protein VH601_21040 [Bryobacteraceae bacterium]|jgi:hypothetical protein